MCFEDGFRVWEAGDASIVLVGFVGAVEGLLFEALEEAVEEAVGLTAVAALALGLGAGEVGGDAVAFGVGGGGFGGAGGGGRRCRRPREVGLAWRSGAFLRGTKPYPGNLPRNCKRPPIVTDRKSLSHRHFRPTTTASPRRSPGNLGFVLPHLAGFFWKNSGFDEPQRG